jgi:hypothetical protein
VRCLGHVSMQPSPATGPSPVFIFFISLLLDIPHWAGPFSFPSLAR